MISQETVEKALDYMVKESRNLAKAKAERVYLENFRKSKFAMLFSEAPDVMGEGDNSRRATVGDREAYAHKHPDYIALLEGLRAAIEKEETLRWRMKSAELKADVWRTQQANARRVDGAHV